MDGPMPDPSTLDVEGDDDVVSLETGQRTLADQHSHLIWYEKRHSLSAPLLNERLRLLANRRHL
jgi:hypothetical protein